MAFPARLACILLLVLLSACEAPDSRKISSSDSDAYDESIDEINRTWEELRVTANACSTADGPCWEDALAASGFEQAVSDFQDTARSLATTVEKGECRSSLGAFDRALEDLLKSLDALRADAAAADAIGIESSATAVLSAWDAAVTAQGSTEVCFPDGLEPATTDR